MGKQVFNSFKELQSIMGENNSVDNTASKDNVRQRLKKQNNYIQKSTEEKSSKRNKFPNQSIKPIDPKLKAIFDALNWLKMTFPSTFIKIPAKIVPLKIGIGQDIADFIKTQENPEFSLTLIRKALSLYTNNFHYLLASSKQGNARIDLQGNISGEITVEQAQYAEFKLNALKERKKNKTESLSRT